MKCSNFFLNVLNLGVGGKVFMEVSSISMLVIEVVAVSTLDWVVASCD